MGVLFLMSAYFRQKLEGNTHLRMNSELVGNGGILDFHTYLAALGHFVLVHLEGIDPHHIMCLYYLVEYPTIVAFSQNSFCLRHTDEHTGH